MAERGEGQVSSPSSASPPMRGRLGPAERLVAVEELSAREPCHKPDPASIPRTPTYVAIRLDSTLAGDL